MRYTSAATYTKKNVFFHRIVCYFLVNDTGGEGLEKKRKSVNVGGGGEFQRYYFASEELLNLLMTL